MIVLTKQDSEPQPDFTLLRPRPDFYKRAHPEPGDVLLTVEIMDSTVYRDRRVKLPLYGRAALGEVWLINAEREEIEVHRITDRTGPQILRRGDTLTISACPDVPFTVDEIFG
ncbi:MAG: Uma2 family endonuclease [Candidatus Rokubacteria bacterium]|nr:Uma2 family endonuclease [Candidatus Rokubacteria bacterium]